MIVLLLGLVAGIMLIFSLLDAISLWPFPAWEVAIPGTSRGWQAAHVGGILNGVMIGGAGLLMQKLATHWPPRLTGWLGHDHYRLGQHPVLLGR